MTRSHPAGQELRVLAGFLWLFLIGISVGLVGPLALLIAPKFGLESGSVAGQTVSALFFGSTATILLAGYLEGKWPSERLPRICSLCFVGGALGIWNAPTWGLTLASFALLGLGYGGISSWFNSEFGIVFRGPKLASWLTALNGFWAVGAVLAPAALARLEPAPVILAFAGLSVLGALALPFLKGIPAHSEADHSSLNWKRILPYCALMALYVGCEVTTGALMSVYLDKVFRFSLADASWLNSQFWMGFAGGRLIFSLAASRMSVYRWMLVCLLLGIVVALLTLSMGLATLAFILLGVCYGPLFPLILVWGTASEARPHRATSALITSGSTAAMLLPGLNGLILFQRESLFPYLIAATIFLILGTATVIRLRQSSAKPNTI